MASINTNFPKFTLDIEVYEKWGREHWAQAKYLVHGYDDVYWTDNLEWALEYLRMEIMRHEGGVKNVK